jgi:hypothetical protein
MAAIAKRIEEKKDENGNSLTEEEMKDYHE